MQKMTQTQTHLFFTCLLSVSVSASRMAYALLRLVAQSQGLNPGLLHGRRILYRLSH